MQVKTVSGHVALCQGRDGVTRVNTFLLGECTPGEWILCLREDARERIDATRAMEINAMLNMLELSTNGTPIAVQGVPFSLPSAISTAQLQQIFIDEQDKQ
jgi:hydrogenase expression/formation protein HypC